MSDNGTLDLAIHPVEIVSTSDLKPHPRNYRSHPDDQREHIRASLREYGQYRNIVVARDLTVLAGHGVLESAIEEGVEQLAVVRLDLDADEPRALKVVALDNELPRFAETDDRKLADLLKGLLDAGEGLFGTGYTDEMLANLVLVTRPASEIADAFAAAEWVGMPEFAADDTPRSKLTMMFASDADRDAFVEQLKLHVVRGPSAWWPPRRPEDVDRSMTFDE